MFSVSSPFAPCVFLSFFFLLGSAFICEHFSRGQTNVMVHRATTIAVVSARLQSSDDTSRKKKNICRAQPKCEASSIKRRWTFLFMTFTAPRINVIGLLPTCRASASVQCVFRYGWRGELKPKRHEHLFSWFCDGCSGLFMATSHERIKTNIMCL